MNISDGPYRSRTFDGTRIDFKHVTSKNVTGMSPTTLLVVRALRALGEARLRPIRYGSVYRTMGSIGWSPKGLQLGLEKQFAELRMEEKTDEGHRQGIS
jgi:hypothetical protein